MAIILPPYFLRFELKPILVVFPVLERYSTINFLIEQSFSQCCLEYNRYTFHVLWIPVGVVGYLKYLPFLNLGCRDVSRVMPLPLCISLERVITAPNTGHIH